MRIQFPLKVEFEITSRCNLGCRHCMVNTNQSNIQELTTDEIFKLIDDWVANGLLEFQLTGGEPTLRDDMIDVAEYAISKGLKVLISTNGTNITEELAERIGKCGAFVEVSLDGSNAEIHDLIRSKGSFDKTVNGIKLLRKYTNKLMIETVIQKNNLNDLRNIYNLSCALKAYRHLFHNLRYVNRTLKNLDFLAISYSEMLRAQELVLEFRKENKIQIQPPYLPVDNYVANVKYNYPSKVFGCGGLVFKCGVRADGSVLPCLLFNDSEDFVIGKIEPGKADHLKEIWNSPKAMDIFGIMHGRMPDGCNRCKNMEYCDGGCKKAALDQGGDLQGQDASCPYVMFDKRL